MHRKYLNSFLDLFLIRIIILFLLTIFFAPNLFSQSLIITPSTPIIDANTNDEKITLRIDVNEGFKEELVDSGTLIVDFYSFDSRIITETSSNNCFIKYKDNITIPAEFVLKVHPESPIEPNDFFYYKVLFRINSIGFSENIKVCVRGEYYRTVYNYVSDYSKTDWTVRYWLSTDRMQNLVRYRLPESDFLVWYPTINNPWDIAAAYQLDLPSNYLTGWGETLIFTYGAYTLKERGWNSNQEWDSLLITYQKDVAPLNGNFTFSLGEKVPTSYFLEQLPTFEGKGFNTGQIDYTIAGRYNKDLGITELQNLGLNPDSILIRLDEVYGTTDFMMIQPKIIGQLGKLISNPLSDSKKPLAVHILSKSVSEGTFSDGVIISHLAKTHRLIVGQINTTSELTELLKHIVETFNSKINILVLADHGSQYGLSFLRIDNNAFMNIAETLQNDATIFLSACSTAGFLPGRKSFAYALSEALIGRTIIAAKNLTSGQLLKYYPESTNSSERYKAFMLNTSVAVIKDGIDYNNCAETRRTDIQIACDSFIWIDGNTYTTSNNSATFTLTNTAGCDSIVTLDLTILKPTNGVDIQTACDSYEWIDGKTYTESNNSATYTLTNAAGCDSIVTLDLNIIRINKSLAKNDSIIIAIQGNANYQWLDCDNNFSIIDGANSQSYNVPTSGNYAVEISQAGCVDTTDCMSFNLVGVSEIKFNNVKVYPNPTSGKVNVNFGGLLHPAIRVLTPDGKLIYEQKTIDTNILQFDLNVTTGIYFIEIYSDKEKAVYKLVKK